MAFVRPSLTTLIDRARADLDGRLPGADSRLRRSALDVLAVMHAGGLHGLYGHLDYASRQLMPDTADAEHLDRWASVWAVARKAAQAASGPVTLTGTDAAVAPEGSILQRGDGRDYVTTADATIAGGVATVTVEAVTAGAAGDALAGVALTFVSPVAGVATAAVVAAGGLTGGLDQELDAALRGRLLDRIQVQPRGGAINDYSRWALEVAEVTRAWVYPEIDGLGTVGVAFVMDGRPDIIPGSGDVDAVAAWIEDRRPVTAAVTVFAPVADPLDLTIALTPATDAVKAAVTASLADLLGREAEPGGAILVSHIREAISIAAGEADHTLTSPTANVVADAGDIATLGVITWT
ncbi:MAG: baseplate J/gp47 family protein [Reyranella sp.]|uniref:baseplate J/gp47 family protein n=1 Tax=Reyranella sp. TaxID=1929291 RepID=UPI00272EEB3B|nr:baseplate J/gp47 family protein [Reyranella sp.]MDP1960870.1 baseplate J/gp47 family protein [Reyranella sp.]MDP2375302.1 baseplate J/gp47 family protein [Reyranella sp.]